MLIDFEQQGAMPGGKFSKGPALTFLPFPNSITEVQEQIFKAVQTDKTFRALSITNFNNLR